MKKLTSIDIIEKSLMILGGIIMKKLLIFLLIMFIGVGLVVSNIVLGDEDSTKEINGGSEIVVGDTLVDDGRYAMVSKDKLLVPVEILKKYIFKDATIDPDGNRIFIHIDSPKFQLENENLTDRIKNGISINFPTQKIDDVQYLNILGLEKVLGIKIRYVENTNRLLIDKIEDECKVGEIKKDTSLRSLTSFLGFRNKIQKLEKGDAVALFNEEGSYYKARSQNGYIGLVSKSKVQKREKSCQTDMKLNQVREKFISDGKLNMVWHQISMGTPDISKDETIPGLNVLMPTWFSINDEIGNVINKSDIKYVKDAHEKGYKVWALIDNSFDKDLTSKILKDDSIQENIISQMLVYSSMYDLDGINIDFENVYYEDKDKLTNFVYKLTTALKEQNLIVSIDMTVPSTSLTWSKFYDRPKLSQIVDYCMIMCYDETSPGSNKSGSVASINWVMRGIENTIKSGIPTEKIILGIPFYTREWEETKDSSGNIIVKAQAIGMEVVKERIEDLKCSPVWLDDCGQYYIEYMKDSKKYRIWVEDERSIELKASLVNKYNLAGISSWRKGFEVNAIWNVLNNVLKDDKTKL